MHYLYHPPPPVHGTMVRTSGRALTQGESGWASDPDHPCQRTSERVRRVKSTRFEKRGGGRELTHTARCMGMEQAVTPAHPKAVSRAREQNPLTAAVSGKSESTSKTI